MTRSTCIRHLRPRASRTRLRLSSWIGGCMVGHISDPVGGGPPCRPLPRFGGRLAPSPTLNPCMVDRVGIVRHGRFPGSLVPLSEK
jgi:hypothetical protein